MHSGKTIPSLVIVAATLLAWWLTWPPAGLRQSAMLAKAVSVTRLRTGDASLQIADVRQWLRDPTTGLPDEWTDVQREVLRRQWEAASAEQTADAEAWRAWRLFLLFTATILLVLVNAAPIFVLAIGSLSTAVLTGLLTAEEGFRGYSESFIILIVVAFTIAVGVSKSGLGRRIAFQMISRFGGSTLGLGYSLMLTDVLIAPAFPSNTARSGVLYPVVNSIAQNSGSEPIDESRLKLGAFLMLCSIVSLSLSSGLWLTAMSANPVGAALVFRITDVRIDFVTWFIAASAPTLIALAVSPWLLYRMFPPQLRRTPEAKQLAKDELRRMGRMSGDEKLTAFVFVGLVTLWALSNPLGINTAAVAIAGLFLLTWFRVLTVQEAASSNGPATFVWFGALYALSTQLNQKGFMDWVGQGVAGVVGGLPWPIAYFLLLATYILIHYGFVSQTAHLLAVMPVFLQVGVSAGVPPELMGMMLLLATNFFSPLTPQASSANAIFVGSGYLQMSEIYLHGGRIVLCNALLFGVIGTAWLWLIGGW